MSFGDPYSAYVEGSVFSENPLGLVIALYEGTIDSIRDAKQCLEAGDIPGRTKAINKAVKLLTELLVSIDHNAGGEISANLKRLYSYVQCRILAAHMQQASAPLDEASKLLMNMLEGWRGAAEKLAAESRQIAYSFAPETPTATENDTWFYGALPEMAGGARVCATF